MLTSLTRGSKSQIAIEYAYRLRNKWPARSVFWIHANNAARFVQSYRSIATAAKIPGIEDPKVDVLNLVFQWLGSDQSGDWLLILDNADDADVFFGLPTVPAAQADAASTESPCLSRYLPQTGTGSILITSRDEGTAVRLTGARKQVLRVDVMSEDDTMALLTKRLPEDASDQFAKKKLIVKLDLVPLAITQASAYITVRGPRMTVAKYLQLIRHDEKNQIHLLIGNEVDLRRDPGFPNSVIRTWQISFSQIKRQNPAAADLLSCMCMLDRQGIPEFLFSEDGDQSLDFEEAIGTLIRFSFVAEEKELKNFAMHRLVQVATRKWIETYGEVERFQKEALRLVSHHYPKGEFENWRTCEALEPHAQIVLSYTYDSEPCKVQRSSILNNEAWYALEQGKFKLSENRIQEAIDIRKLCLGPDDPGSLQSLSLLALTYKNQGRWTEAEKLQVQVLKTMKRVRRAEHQKTLTSMNNLASTYIDQGRWTEAKKLQVQVLETMKRVLGAEHPETLRSMNNLVSTYSYQGRWTEAEKLQVQVLETRKRVLRAEHPHTLTSMHNLAKTYNHQGRWTEAEKLQVQVLETRNMVLGAEHPDTLMSINNLAWTYHDQNRLSEAIELTEKIVELSKKNLGANHLRTLACMNNLAWIHHDQDRYSEAIELMEKVVELSTKNLGANHPNTLRSMHSLAVFYHDQDRHNEAIELMERVIELREKDLGADHPDTIDSIDDLADWKDT